MTCSFLDVARTGLNAWWRYVLGIVVIAVCWQLIGPVVAMVLIAIADSVGLVSEVNWGAFQTENPFVNFFAQNVTFPFAWLGIYVTIRYLHRRPIRSLVAANRPIRWRRIGLGAGVWFAIGVALSAVDVLQHPDLFRVTFAPGAWLTVVVLVLLLTPIQTTAEELVFRGYLLQATGLLTRQPLLLILPSSLVFAMVHAANPEFLANPLIGWLPYFTLGVLLVAATLRDDGSELAIGLHAANNIYAFVGVSTAGGTLVTAPVLTRLAFDPVRAVVETIVAAAAFWILVFVLGRRQRPATVAVGDSA
jgi:membrane protease YdiL (CAAX protease family)